MDKQTLLAAAAAAAAAGHVHYSDISTTPRPMGGVLTFIGA